MQILLSARADVEELTSTSGKAPLSLAAERGHVDVMQELLRRHAQAEQPNRDGTTALMCAAHRTETQAVALLLASKSLVNVVDNDGWSALMYAVNAPVTSPPAPIGHDTNEARVNLDGVLGRRSCTEVLLLHKAEVNAQTGDGLTPLIIACGRDRPMAIRRLLECRADINMASARGQTALIMASAYDLPMAVRALIIAKAEVNQANAQNESPLSIAEKRGNWEVETLLKKAGAVAPKKKPGKKGKKK